MSKFNKIFEARSEEKKSPNNAEEVKEKPHKQKKEISTVSKAVKKEKTSVDLRIEDPPTLTSSESIAAPEKKTRAPAGEKKRSSLSWIYNLYSPRNAPESENRASTGREGQRIK